MKEREIEDLLARVVLPPAPDGLRERVLQQARSARPQGSIPSRVLMPGLASLPVASMDRGGE